MFEFDKYEARRHGTPAAPDEPYEPLVAVEAMSLLVWGEHCVECAAPACFSTCDLYEARPDLRCRRFVFGAHRNTAFRSLRGYGAEVAFKKWAKLEARGNTRLEPVDRVLRQEERVGASAPWLNAAGRLVHGVTRDARWRHLTHTVLERKARKLHRGDKPLSPEAFVLEVYNPGDRPVRLQLTMSIARQEVGRDVTELPPPFTTTVELAPGYNRTTIEAIRFRSITDAAMPFDIALIPEADGDARLVFLMADFVRFAAATSKGGAPKRPDIKCVAFDLDNTLWEGVLLENPDVALRPGIAELIEALDRRGILLSLVSKNDHEHAWARVEALGLADYFLHPQINWMPKSANLQAIADRLNINIDTFAFVDDNPFELEEVATALPAVDCVDVATVDDLLDRPRYRGSSSVEAKNRRQYYRDAIERETKQATFGDDYIGFLRSCDITIDITAVTPDDFDRVAELVQRTNQLNFSGRKYDRDDLRRIVDDERLRKYVVKCADRFGSYGTVGFCLVEETDAAMRVDDFMLSCRVQGKFIEQALFHFLMTRENPSGRSRLEVNYRKTDRNTPADNVLAALGFEDDGDRGRALDVEQTPLTCDFIDVRHDVPTA